MNNANKGTGAASMLAVALVLTAVWAAKTFGGVDIPEALSLAWQAAATVGFGYLIHDGRSS